MNNETGIHDLKDLCDRVIPNYHSSHKCTCPRNFNRLTIPDKCFYHV